MTQFSPRDTEPSYDNPYYISTDYGGFNPCIVIGDDGSCIPNCVGYANGRSRELTDNQAEMPACNACDFLDYSGYETGTEPRLGAVIVWGGDYGHVGVVESIDGDTITVSQSNWGGTRFFLTEHSINDLDIPYHPFLGFIYNPYVTDEPEPDPEPEPTPEPTPEPEPEPVKPNEDYVDTFITGLYHLILNRQPDDDGFKFWKEKIMNGESAGSVAVAFADSDEAKGIDWNNNEFVKRIYESALEREPDADGLKFWVSKLTDARKEVVSGIVGSDEFSKLCNDAGMKK